MAQGVAVKPASSVCTDEQAAKAANASKTSPHLLDSTAHLPRPPAKSFTTLLAPYL